MTTEQTAAPNPGTPAAPATGAAPAAPAASPFVTPWANAQGVYMIGEGENAKPWYEGIAEEPVKEYMKAKNYANPYEAALAAYNANKLNKLSPDVEAFVQGKATPEQEANVFKMLGRPETSDAYDFKVPQGVETDPSLMKFGKDLFHELGLSPQRAQKAFDKWQEFAIRTNAEQADAKRVQNDAEMADLVKRWGPESDAHRVAGNTAVRALGLSDALIEKIEANIGSAAIVELLAAIGKKTSEGKFLGSGTTADPNDPNTMTPQQAQAKINSLRSDEAFNKKLTDKNAEGHAEALALMEKLYAKAP